MLNIFYPFKKTNKNELNKNEKKEHQEEDIKKLIKEENDYISFFHYLNDKNIMKYEINESWLLFILKVTDYILNEWDDINPFIDQLYNELYFFSKKLKYQEEKKDDHWFQWLRFIIYHCRSTIYYYQKNWMYSIIYCKKTLQLLPSNLSSPLLMNHLSPLLYQKFISLQLHTLMLLTSSKKYEQQMNKFYPSHFMMKKINKSITSTTITTSINPSSSSMIINDSTSETSSPTTLTTTTSSSSSVSSNTVLTNLSGMICSYCFTEKKNMPVCAQCKIQIYCSIKCLKLDKQRHFELCQKYQDDQ